MQHTLELKISIEIHFLFVLPEQVSLVLPGAGSRVFRAAGGPGGVTQPRQR